MKLPVCKCLRCGHSWTPRVAEPRWCPACNSPYWNRPRRSSSTGDPVEDARRRLRAALRPLGLKFRDIDGVVVPLVIYESQEDLDAAHGPGWTVEYHDRVMQSVAHLVRAHGGAPRMIAFDRADYDTWRGDKPDNAGTRAAWAAAKDTDRD